MTSLKDLLPRAGMTYSSEEDFLSRRDRDMKVFMALKQAGIINTANDTPEKASEKAVDKALADLFTLVAQPYVMFHILDEGVDLPGLTQSTASWVRHIAEPVFTQLIQRLIDARLAWQKNPSEPLEIGQHSATARKIDMFMDFVEGQVNSAISGLFDIIGDSSIKEEENSEEQVVA
ncbi:hypothetical protein F5Y06DRAFT_295815 [Hypoxylon sp. FL0890]|nr:hypothetical protein F5Y06DRAFT_295815 [Hypoxylon sp. FL0890]